MKKTIGERINDSIDNFIETLRDPEVSIGGCIIVIFGLFMAIVFHIFLVLIIINIIREIFK